MSTNDEQATYGRIVHIGPADERGRVTVTHEDGTIVTVRKDQLPPMDKPTERSPMLSDDVTAMVARHAIGKDALATGIAVAEEMQLRMNKAVRAIMSSGRESYIRLRREFDTLNNALESKIDSGELMVVKTVKESTIPVGPGDQHMPCCGNMIDCVESFPPQVGQHCVCGAKIVEG